MPDARQASTHLRQIDASLQELIALGNSLASPIPSCRAAIANCIQATCVMLVGARKSLDPGDNPEGTITFTRYEDWVRAMGSVHRAFFNNIVGFVEEACADLCEAKGLALALDRRSLIDEVCALLEKLKATSDERAVTAAQAKLKRLARTEPNLLDYVNALTAASHLTPARQKMWRRFFAALHIVRNKTAHARARLSKNEEEMLRKAGFESFIGPDGVQAHTGRYKEICDYALTFFNEVE